MTRPSPRFRFVQPQRRRALLISVKRAGMSRDDCAASSAELVRLAHGLGYHVFHTLHVSRAHAALLSEERLSELASWTGGPGPLTRGDPTRTQTSDGRPHAELVLVDGAISPSQQRALELASGCDVLDRSAVILRVFAQRARTREAQLQVELAELVYRTPRLRDERAHDDRGGGGGRGERGDTNVALAKQRNRARIAELHEELAVLPERSAARRARRAGLPEVALVGYTNAGKSSWLRALSASEVHVADELFATVDLTVRALARARGPRILLSDTVGFLAHLPHELIASFRATLEEARHADLLLAVVDASDPAALAQLAVTEETLAAIGADHVRRQIVLNKADRLGEAERAAWRERLPDAWLVSAHAAQDVAWLSDEITHRVLAARAG